MEQPHIPEQTPVTLGTRHAPSWAERYPFSLSMEDRRRHLFVLGQTGVGKSTLLKSIIKQDILAGRGVGYIDPHGQDAEDILRSIPSWRADDVVYFNAADFANPMAWNLLAQDRIDPTDRDRVASIIVSGFQGIFGNSWGPNLEYVLFGCLHTLLARENTSILGVLRLITEPDYRAHVLKFVSDPGVRMFWRNFEKQEREHKDATGSVINKVGRLFLSPTMRNIFGQPVNKIRPRKIMDEKKILIVNLAKGVIGDDAARIIGALLISQFFSAALTRADTPEENRSDFSLVVDEFTSFSTTVIAKILSEARKYRLSLCIGSQFLGAIDEETEQAIFGNVGAVVSFRVGDDAALLAKHFGDEYLPKAFTSLDNHTVLVKQLMNGVTQDPFVGFTERFELPATVEGKRVRYLDPETIIRQSRRHYAERRDVTEAKIERWMNRALPETGEGKHKRGSSRTDHLDAEIRRSAVAHRRNGPASGSGFARRRSK